MIPRMSVLPVRGADGYTDTTVPPIQERAHFVSAQLLNGPICKPGFSGYCFTTPSHHREKPGLLPSSFLTEYNIPQKS